jgi:hypothetical protein
MVRSALDLVCSSIIRHSSSPRSGVDASRVPIFALLPRILLLFLLTSFAETGLAENVGDTETLQRDALAETFVQEKLAVWQRNLSLDDWRISIVACRRSDLKARTLGGIRWDKGRKTAEIRVLAASEYQQPLTGMLEDMEFTIVHELVHLHLASLPRSEASRRDEERAVNQLALALLRLDRRK